MTATRARLFGLDVRASPALAGVPDEARLVAAPPLDVRVAPRRALLDGGMRGAGEPISHHRDDRGRPLLTITRSARAGTLIVARGWGAYHIDAAVRTISCAPVRMAAWRWQRYLIGQALPFASVLRGFEVLHASAVALDGRAIAVTGPSQTGKSTVAAAWIARGVRLVADDVVALDLDESGTPRAHPGPGLLSLRPAVLPLISRSEALGRLLGEDVHGLRFVVERHPDALPLGALVFLTPAAAGARLRVERVADPEPRRLLGATFNLALRTPERLERQLDVCHAVASRVPVLEAAVPMGVDPAELADAVERAL